MRHGHGPTPPTQPLPPSDDATRRRPDDATQIATEAAMPQQGPAGQGGLRLYSGIACGSLLLALVIGIGGFLGVRALSDQPTTPPPASGTTEDGQETDDGQETADGSEETAEGTEDPGGQMPEIPVGAQQTQPQGTAVPFDAPEAEGYVEVTFGEVLWDADAEIAEANMFNDPPAEGNRYVMVTLEATYRGSGSFTAYIWAKFEYVAEDGTTHSRQVMVTPNYVSGGHGQIRDGESFSEEVVFEVPADTPEGGQFVIADFPTDTEDGTWVDAV